MMSLDLLTKLVESYLENQLPAHITVHTVKYRIVAGEYHLISDIPEWQKPTHPPPLPENCSREQVTLKPTTASKQTILAGYSEKARILIIAQEEVTQ